MPAMGSMNVITKPSVKRSSGHSNKGSGQASRRTSERHGRPSTDLSPTRCVKGLSPLDLPKPYTRPRMARLSAAVPRKPHVESRLFSSSSAPNQFLTSGPMNSHRDHREHREVVNH